MANLIKKSRPLPISLFSATPFESTLLEETIKQGFSKEKIRRVVADRAYDNDPLDERHKKMVSNLFNPTNVTGENRKLKTEDNCVTTHQRWTLERFLAWLHNYRKCVVRYERKADNCQAFLYLAAIIMLLRYF